MKRELIYIELKSGYSDNGPAWIGYVEYSKSGKTVYFRDTAFPGDGHGRFWDVETGERYWITGIKKNGSNRHASGRGPIQIDEDAIAEYENITGTKVAMNKYFVVGNSKPINNKKFEYLLNAKE